MVFEKIPGGSGKFNTWLINGKPYPHDREFVLEKGYAIDLIMRNRTDDAHPMHLASAFMGDRRDQRQEDRRTSLRTQSLFRTTGVPQWTSQRTNLDCRLFHCHIQQHMDYGFKALFRYA